MLESEASESLCSSLNGTFNGNNSGSSQMADTLAAAAAHYAATMMGATCGSGDGGSGAAPLPSPPPHGVPPSPFDIYAPQHHAHAEMYAQGRAVHVDPRLTP